MYPAGSRTTNWSTGGHVKRSTDGRYKKSGTFDGKSRNYDIKENIAIKNGILSLDKYIYR